MTDHGDELALQAIHLPLLGQILDVSDEVTGIAAAIPDQRNADQHPDGTSALVVVALLDPEPADLTAQGALQQLLDRARDRPGE